MSGELAAERRNDGGRRVFLIFLAFVRLAVFLFVSVGATFVIASLCTTTDTTKRPREVGFVSADTKTDAQHRS